MKHVGASSRSETPLQRRRESDSIENVSAPKTVTGWEDVPRGGYFYDFMIGFELDLIINMTFFYGACY